MPAPSAHRPPPASFPHRPHAGFSLVELAVVVAIISILVAISAPIAKHLVLKARATAVINDLRVYTAAFQTYANENGDWPDGDGTPAAFPSGMSGYLGPTNWQSPTPIGGYYTWDPNSTQQGGRYRAVIVISSTPDSPVSSDALQLLEIDRELDDGNLDTGNFFLGYRNYPVFVLEH